MQREAGTSCELCMCMVGHTPAHRCAQVDGEAEVEEAVGVEAGVERQIQQALEQNHRRRRARGVNGGWNKRKGVYTFCRRIKFSVCF